MDMNKIKELLSIESLEVSEEIIQELIKEKGWNGSKLSDDQVLAIVDEIKEGGKLSLTNPVQPASQQLSIAFSEAIKHASEESKQEVKSFGEQIRNGISKWENRESQEIADMINNAPDRVVSSVIDKIQTKKADGERFRRFADDIANAYR